MPGSGSDETVLNRTKPAANTAYQLRTRARHETRRSSAGHGARQRGGSRQATQHRRTDELLVGLGAVQDRGVVEAYAELPRTQQDRLGLLLAGRRRLGGIEACSTGSQVTMADAELAAAEAKP